MNGCTVIEQQLIDTKSNINLNLQPGFYNILIINKFGEIILIQKIVKN